MDRKTPPVDLLINFFNEKFGLGHEEIQSLLGADIRHFQKGDIFLKVGQQAEKCYFVIKGCVR
jgi:CRP-like cAMP-binding protein